ncbi:translation elongation factor Ts [bacterium Unc6]|nr:translation elongation factor Ts [bacterium Unc6]
MADTLEQIRELRFKTSAGVGDCRQALDQSRGDINLAIEILRKKGIALVAKRSGRTTKEGMVASYIHHNGKLGVLVEINCETDFVAKNEEFQSFVKDITLQVAASAPLYVKKEDIPSDVCEKEKEILKAQISGNKPAVAIDKIIEGRLQKFYEEKCLLEQPYVKDPNKKIKDLLGEIVGKIGENILIRRFVRFQVGEEV